MPTSANQLLCACPAGSTQLLDDRCEMCVIGEEVPNEDQTACVGRFELTSLKSLLLYLLSRMNEKFLVGNFMIIW